jgi:hypothetical protein
MLYQWQLVKNNVIQSNFSGSFRSKKVKFHWDWI